MTLATRARDIGAGYSHLVTARLVECGGCFGQRRVEVVSDSLHL